MLYIVHKNYGTINNGTNMSRTMKAEELLPAVPEWLQDIQESPPRTPALSLSIYSSKEEDLEAQYGDPLILHDFVSFSCNNSNIVVPHLNTGSRLQPITACRPVSRISSRFSRVQESLRPLSSLTITVPRALYLPSLYQADNTRSLHTLSPASPKLSSLISDHELTALPQINAHHSNQDSLDIPALLPPRPPTAPPDGGFMAWAHAWAGFFVIFNCWGLNFSFGVFEQHYAAGLVRGYGASRIAWIGSTQLFLVFFLAAPIGRLYDLGYFRVFFNVGSALLVLFVFVTSFCESWWQLFLVQGVLTGVAMGMVFCSGIVVLMGWFDRDIGLAMGIGAAGSSVGGIVYTVVAQRLLPRVGYAWTIRTMGLIVLLTLIAPNAIFRPRPRSLDRQRSRLQMGWAWLREPGFLLMTAGMFFAFWGLYFGFYYVRLPLLSHHQQRSPAPLTHTLTYTDHNLRNHDLAPRTHRLNQPPPRHARRQPPRPLHPRLDLRPLHRPAKHAHPVHPALRYAALPLDRHVHPSRPLRARLLLRLRGRRHPVAVPGDRAHVQRRARWELGS